MIKQHKVGQSCVIAKHSAQNRRKTSETNDWILWWSRDFITRTYTTVSEAGLCWQVCKNLGVPLQQIWFITNMSVRGCEFVHACVRARWLWCCFPLLQETSHRRLSLKAKRWEKETVVSHFFLNTMFSCLMNHSQILKNVTSLQEEKASRSFKDCSVVLFRSVASLYLVLLQRTLQVWVWGGGPAVMWCCTTKERSCSLSAERRQFCRDGRASSWGRRWTLETAELQLPLRQDIYILIQTNVKPTSLKMSSAYIVNAKCWKTAKAGWKRSLLKLKIN